MPTALLLVLFLATLQHAVNPYRQFDFWIGEWSVRNIHTDLGGPYRAGDMARARITPVCGGKAVLEEWTGPFRGSRMVGFSLRAYDRELEDWHAVLSWISDGDNAFRELRGSFHHGRAEFVEGHGHELTRYTFSDCLADTVRWDSALTTDGGTTWRTTWIREFSRRRPAAEVTQDLLFEVAWTEGKHSPHAAARRLDWMLGRWTGRQTDASTGEEREARLRCKLLSKDCLVLDLLETRADGAEDWDERLCVRGYAARAGAWEAHTIHESDALIRASSGSPEEDVAVFEGRDGPPGHGTRRETLRRLSDVEMVIEEHLRRAGEGDFEPVRVTELRRGR